MKLHFFFKLQRDQKWVKLYFKFLSEKKEELMKQMNNLKIIYLMFKSENVMIKNSVKVKQISQSFYYNDKTLDLILVLAKDLKRYQTWN